MELEYETMFEAGVHIGHQVKRWNPKFGLYLYRHLHGISIIDLEKTRACLEKAAVFLMEQIQNGATVLLVGTKPQAQELIRGLGKATEMPFCANRWLGGCLTNFKTIETSLAKYKRFLSMEESGELDQMFKKESSAIRREMVRMHRGFEGILHLNACPNVLFVVDAMKEEIAIREARRLQIPIVGIVDTNSDPTTLDFPIPANDDSVKALRVLFDVLQGAMLQGVELKKLNQANKLLPNAAAFSLRTKSWMRKRPVQASKLHAVGSKPLKRTLEKKELKEEKVAVTGRSEEKSRIAQKRATDAKNKEKSRLLKKVKQNVTEKPEEVAQEKKS
ncbi:MAG: 30S ribosomal protein S2 [Opitutales bacterium]|nr:30S ribosomal protein S2 [Opitutales bacterium]